ncbi:MAG: hypothetical protein HY782_17535 [Chloroflexi bacterium]|nr:hypothetical protein [Chloroflexota bacterium]
MGYWLINTAGIGGLLVVAVGLAVLVAYARMLRWIRDGADVGGEGDGHP